MYMSAAAVPSAATPTSKRLIEVDGLRSLAILPVLFNHCYSHEGLLRSISFIGDIGWLGVDLFFVLSGFLITGILVDTVGRKNYYRNFMIRRVLRIFPLYYCCLIAFTIAGHRNALQWHALQEWGGVGWFFSYLGNFRTAWMRTNVPIFSFDPLWSLQVEEQFYLVYPFVVLVLSRSGLRKFLIACVIGAPVLRAAFFFLAPGSITARYMLTPCRMDSLALGGLCALIKRSTLAEKITLSQMQCVALASAALTLVCFFLSENVMTVLGFTPMAITSGAVLMMVLLWPSHITVRWLRWRPLVYTGQVAYGLYLLHAPAGWIGRSIIGHFIGHTIPGHSTLSVPITYVCGFIAAGLSWRFLESPILLLKDRFTRWESSVSFPEGADPAKASAN